MNIVLAAAIKTALGRWKTEAAFSERLAQLANPSGVAEMLCIHVEQALQTAGVALSDVRQHVLICPFTHLEGVFDATEEVDTPIEFIPLPDTEATVTARGAALALHGVLALETVSYGTENEGELFVNLVVMPGSGRFADKSKSLMRGHTDGVSFPLNGEENSEDPRIAPSPDVVTLAGLRNPNNVETTVMALADVLERMTPEDIFELKKRQFSMNSQLTFVEGMKELLGEVLVAHGEAVLTNVDNATHVRYSHKNVMPIYEQATRASVALDNFKATCKTVEQDIVVKPGDILLVSNRLGLHGRADPGGTFGGKSRWFLRTYGLNTAGLDAQKRHLGNRPPYVLFP